VALGTGANSRATCVSPRNVTFQNVRGSQYGSSMSVARPVSYYPAAEYLQPRTQARVVAGLLAALATVATAVIWWFFVYRAAGQRVERWALAGAEAHSGWGWMWAQPALDAVSIGLIIGATLVAIAIAVLRRRWVLALQAVVLVAGANATTQILKETLPRPHLLTGWTGPNSLPSGHTTVAASVSAAMLIVAPRRWRPLIAILGTLWTIAAGNSTIAHQWHRPSDVVAAMLVTFAWAAAACALSSRGSLDVPTHPHQSMASPVSKAMAAALLVVGGLLLLGGLFTLLSLLQVGDVAPPGGHTRAYGGGMAGAGGAVAILFGLLLLVRQATACPRRYQVTANVPRQYIPSPEAPLVVPPPGPGVSTPEVLVPHAPPAFPVMSSAPDRMEY